MAMPEAIAKSRDNRFEKGVVSDMDGGSTGGDWKEQRIDERRCRRRRRNVEKAKKAKKGEKESLKMR